MKTVSSFRSWSFSLAMATTGTLVALPARAQQSPPTDGPAPPAGEPVNPWQGQAPSAPDGADAVAPITSPGEKPAELAKDSDAPPGMEPTTPSPALVYLESQRDAAEARERNRVDTEAAEPPDDGKLGYHQDHWIGVAGVRVGKIAHRGFDPFADSDELAQFSLGLGHTVVSAGSFSLAGLLLWDIGGRSDTARSAESNLTVHRLTLGAEGRYHFFRQLFVFGRVAPGALHSIATLEGDTAGVENRAARKWVFATDLSAGATFELAGWGKRSRTRQPSAWISFDGGYGFAGESELSLSPDETGDGPERGEPVELGPMALRGPFMRGAVVVTY